MFKKFLVLTLTLLMILSVFVGCGKKQTALDEETTPEVAETTSETTADESEKGTLNFEANSDFTVNDTSIYDELTIEDLLKPENFQGSDIPEDRDYGGYQFNVLADTTNKNYEFIESSDGDLIKDAVINREEWIEQYVGIDFVITETDGGYGNMEGFAADIEAASGSGSPYDLALAYNLIPPVVAAKGLSKDLTESKNLNLLNTTKEYWGKEIKQEIMIGGRIFWMSDNSSWNNIRQMLCIFVNTEYFSKINPEYDKFDLYDMVKDGIWTFENMYTLAQDSYENTNVGDDKTDGVDDGDSFGLQAALSGPWLDNWLYAAGFRYTKLNNRGTYDWTLNDQGVIDFIDWWHEKLADDDVDKTDSNYSKDNANNMFQEGRAMFALSAVRIIEHGVELNYTVLPMPLYNKNVKNSYSTPFSNDYSSWLIPKATKNEAFERSATVLELLAAEGNRRLAPVYFEIYLKRQNAGHDEQMQTMFNIIRNSIVFDMGYLYGSVLKYEEPDSGNLSEVFIGLRRIWNGNGTGFYSNMTTFWASVGQSATTKLNNLMVDILDY